MPISDWVSAMFAIRLPLYPRLEIRLKTQFLMESVHSVLVGEVNLALVTAPPEDTQITAVPFAPAPLYAVLPENHLAAHKEPLVSPGSGQQDEWILFPKRFDPLVFDAIMDAAQRGPSLPSTLHDAIAPQQAVDLVLEHVGVAILTQPAAPGFHPDGVVVKPLSDGIVVLQNMRDPESRQHLTARRRIRSSVSSANMHPSAYHQSERNYRCPPSCQLEKAIGPSRP